jgi:hypothetical protein
MLSAEELEAEYYRRLEAQKLAQERKRFANTERDVDLERVWVAYVWVTAEDDPTLGKWMLGGFRRRRNLRRVQTMGRFFAKVRRKLGVDKKSQVMVVDLGTALRRATGADQTWQFRAPQYQERKSVVKVKQYTPAVVRVKHKKTRARQKAFIFNPKTTKYIALGRNIMDKRKPGYLYLGPLTSQQKRQAQFEAKRVFRIWSDLLVVATSELSKPLRAALARNRRVRAGVTRILWPEVPPSFDMMWDKYVRRLMKHEFHDAIAADDPGLLDAKAELHALWEQQKCPWLTLKWFQRQIDSWSVTCAKVNVAKLLPPKKKGSSVRSKTTRSSRVKRNVSAKKARRNFVDRSRKRVTVMVKRKRSVNVSARRFVARRAMLKRS